ncbi:MAG: hypothetical protein O7H39_07505 [Gammaproteobacteria bacterium]|nr:hypothetical protein [Gammaproteobacteria bacterium]
MRKAAANKEIDKMSRVMRESQSLVPQLETNIRSRDQRIDRLKAEVNKWQDKFPSLARQIDRQEAALRKNDQTIHTLEGQLKAYSLTREFESKDHFARMNAKSTPDDNSDDASGDASAASDGHILDDTTNTAPAQPVIPPAAQSPSSSNLEAELGEQRERFRDLEKMMDDQTKANDLNGEDKPPVD